MDLQSRWDRVAASFVILSLLATAGCQALFGGHSSTPQTGLVQMASSSLAFGTVVIGSSQTLTDAITNSSAKSVTISAATASDTQFSITAPALPLTLAPGQNASLSVRFTPRAAGQPSGEISVVTNAASSSKMALAVSGKAVMAGQISVSPSSVSFGNVQVGKSQSQTATLTNSGGSSVIISQAAASSAGFSLSGLTLPVTLSPGQSTALSIVFAPKAVGAAKGSISMTGAASLTTSAMVGASASNSKPTNASIAVTGDGITPGQLGVSPGSINFGNVTVGSAQSQTATLSNSGGTSVTIMQATATGAGFNWNGLTLPLTLAAGQSASFQVNFAPQAAGSANGSVAILSSASSSALMVSLTGAGVTAGALTVTPASIGFGSIPVGSSQKQSGTLTNSGGSNVTITQANTTGTGFSLTGLTLPLTLAAGQTATFSVAFAPQAAGAATGNVAFASTASAVNLPLSGAGVVSSALAATPASVNFGNVLVGVNQPQTVTLTNGSSSSVTLTQAVASGSGFSASGLNLPLTLTAGQSTSFSVTFAPSASGSVTGSVAISSTASNSLLNVPLSGIGVTPGVLAANPASVDFSAVQLGTSVTKSETLTNSGGSTVNISQANATGPGFSITGFPVPTSLSAGQSLTFSVVFAPQAGGSASGSVAISSSASNPSLAITLSGNGATPGQLAVNPTTLSFGSVTVGTSQSLSGTLTASGSSVTVNSGSSNSTEFVLSGVSFPLTIAAGQSASFTVAFSPQTSGTAAGTISFASNATNGPVVDSATGSGVAAPQHSVALSWNASTSTVVGYNVYRGAQSGGPYAALNSAPDATTNYTDNSVLAGATYYYVVTAVDATGTESAYSNQTQAVVPKP
jgi:hypothetical protein